MLVSSKNLKSIALWNHLVHYGRVGCKQEINIHIYLSLLLKMNRQENTQLISKKVCIYFCLFKLERKDTSYI